MVVLEVCAVFGVIVMIGVVNRLCEICMTLAQIRQCLTNPNLTISDQTVERVIEPVAASKKHNKSKSNKA